MQTQISPMLVPSAMETLRFAFYEAAFGAELLWHLDGGGHVVAGVSIDGARFFLAHESPPHGMQGPAAAGFTTVRIELLVGGVALSDWTTRCAVPAVAGGTRPCGENGLGVPGLSSHR